MFVCIYTTQIPTSGTLYAYQAISLIESHEKSPPHIANSYTVYIFRNVYICVNGILVFSLYSAFKLILDAGISEEISSRLFLLRENWGEKKIEVGKKKKNLHVWVSYFALNIREYREEIEYSVTSHQYKYYLNVYVCLCIYMWY